MIATFFTYIFHDTFTVLKVFSKQNERSLSNNLWKTSCTRTTKFTNRSVFNTLIYCFRSWFNKHEPNCDLPKKRCLLKLQGTKGLNLKKLSGTTSCIIMTMFTKPYFFKTASAPVFCGFLIQKRTKRKGEILDKLSWINPCTWTTIFLVLWNLYAW